MIEMNPLKMKRHSSSNGQRWTPFAYGFRPFFLAAISYAPLAIIVWLWVYAAGGLPLPSLPAQAWHGHEMLFGFVGAAVAGFLLTAVPSWTGTKGFSGSSLIVLTLLWLIGRLVFACATWMPASALLAGELIFLPALMFLIAPPLIRTRHRNMSLLIVLTALWSADAIFCYALTRGDASLATSMLRMSINVVLLLITVIGGRIIPAFTGNALRARSIDAPIRTWKWLEITVITAMALVVLIDLVAPFHPLAAIVAATAACAHALRLAGWQGSRTLKEPIVWVLHLAYAWLPVGLVLKSIQLLSPTAWTAQWLHALTMGAIALMVIAVITRASLGHTGRPLVGLRTVTAAYVLLAAAALMRVFGGVVFAASYAWTLKISGGLWIAAFALIIAAYAPILLQPRIDGRPG